MPLPSGCSIGVMDDAEVTTLWGWARDEGWNPGLHDMSVAGAADPEAFVALRNGEELVAGGSVFRYDDTAGFMGLFIVRSDLRRRGLGRELWYWRRDHLLARLAPGATIGMDGVYDMVPFYERGGFRPAYRHVRYQGIAAASDAADAVALGSDAFDEIEVFDKQFVLTPRPAFLRGWLSRPAVRVVGVRDGGRLVAYGVRRRCVTGWKVGPLFALQAHAARQVARTLLADVPGEPVQIDVPDVNLSATALATELGLVETFGCVRLYYGPTPTLPVQQIYAVTSLEFG